METAQQSNLNENELRSMTQPQNSPHTSQPERSKRKKKKHIGPFAFYRNVVIRFFLLYRHVIGLIMGGFVAHVKALPPYKRKGLRSIGSRVPAFFVKILVKKELRNQPLGVQLRQRLEMLGPTYIKLGQLMAIREDILPKNITDELKLLLDQLPEIPFEAIREIIEDSLDAPLNELFIEVHKEAIGSASIGQTHRATTWNGRPVVIKVIKPGIRETILSDIKLLQILSNFLEWIIPRYQPKLILNEFGRYTQREIDLTFEADNVEIFSANFKKDPDVVFPKIYRDLSTPDVLCMEYIDGLKPYHPGIFELSEADQARIIDLGAGAIIKMIFEDGFFHADLHPGNIIVLPGPKIAFIDVGIVGRFEERIMRSMFYYFYSLINDDIESTTKYLLTMARIDKAGDIMEFRRAVSDLYRRYLIHAARGNFSLAQLVMESLVMAGKHRVFFPVEMTLMVKALLTFEGVGLHLNPKLDIPKLSAKHIKAIYKRRYSPEQLFNQFKRGIPAAMDVLVRLPEIISDSTRFWDDTLQDKPKENPLAGLRSGLIASAFVIGAVIAYVQGASPVIWAVLFVTGALLALFGK